MNALYTRLFTYNDWANKIVLDALERRDPPPQALARMSHLLTAQHIWHARVTGTHGPTELFPEYPLAQLRELNDHSTDAWLTFTSRLLKEQHLDIITYRSTGGAACQSMLIDILAHIINHSTHHRGQVIASIRAAGETPPATDFIFFTRTAQM